MTVKELVSELKLISDLTEDRGYIFLNGNGSRIQFGEAESKMIGLVIGFWNEPPAVRTEFIQTDGSDIHLRSHYLEQNSEIKLF